MYRTQLMWAWVHDITKLNRESLLTYHRAFTSNRNDGARAADSALAYFKERATLYNLFGVSEEKCFDSTYTAWQFSGAGVCFLALFLWTMTVLRASMDETIYAFSFICLIGVASVYFRLSTVVDPEQVRASDKPQGGRANGSCSKPNLGRSYGLQASVLEVLLSLACTWWIYYISYMTLASVALVYVIFDAITRMLSSFGLVGDFVHAFGTFATIVLVSIQQTK